MPKMSPLTKYITIPCHFFRTKVTELEIDMIDVSITTQLVDQFNKGLIEDMFMKSRKELMGW